MNFEPTNHAPGTVEKLDVLRHRASMLQELFHPLDKDDYTGVKIVPTTHQQRHAARGTRGAYRCKSPLGNFRKGLGE
jgi:hypothetical protein